MSGAPPMDATMLAAMQQMLAAYMNKEKEKEKSKDNDKSNEKDKKNDDDANGWKSKKNKKSSKEKEQKKEKEKDRKRDRDREKDSGKSKKSSASQHKERASSDKPIQTIIQHTQAPVQHTQSLASTEVQYHTQTQYYSTVDHSTIHDRNGASSSNSGQREQNRHSLPPKHNDSQYDSCAPYDRIETESSSGKRVVKMEHPVSSYRTAQHESIYSESFPETIELFDGGIEEPRDRLTYRALQKELSRCIQENFQLKEQCGLNPAGIHVATAHQSALSAVADSRIFSDIGLSVHERGSTSFLQHSTLLSCIVSLVESNKLHLNRSEIGTICTYITDALSSHSFTQNDLDEVLTHIKTLIRHLMASGSSTLIGARYNMLAELLLSVSTTPAMSPYVIIEAVDELVDFVTTLQSSLVVAPSAAQATLVLIRHAEVITRSRHLMNAVESALVVPSSPHPDVAEQVVERFSTLASIPLDGPMLQYAPLLCASVWRLISVAAEMNSVTASRTLVEHIHALEQARDNRL